MSSIVRRLWPQNKSTGDRSCSSNRDSEQTDATRNEGSNENKFSSRIVRRERIEIVFPKVRRAALLPDGEHLVSGDKDGRIRRWQVKDGTKVGTLMDVGSGVSSMAVSRDGKWIVSGDEDGKVMVWDAISHEKVRVIKAHREWVYAVDISPDGTKIASGADDQTASVWSISTKRLLGPFKHDDWVVAVKFSPNGRLVATATWECNSVRIYDSQDGRLLVDFPVQVSSGTNHSLAWWSDEQLFVLSFDGNIYCLDVYTRTAFSQWVVHDPKYYCCLSLAINGAFIAVSAGSSVSFWDTTTHMQIGNVIHHTGRVSSLAISVNHDLLTAGGAKINLQDLLNILPSPYRDQKFEIQRRYTEAHVKETFEAFARSGVSISTLIPILENTAQELRIQFPDAEGMVKQKEDSMNEATRSLCAENANSNERIANLEQTNQELREKLARSQHEADVLVKRLAGSHHKAETLLGAYRRKDLCETLYADGHVVDAAHALLEIEGTASDDMRADTLIMNWIFEFTNKCIGQLKRIGDEALQIDNRDEALAAYSTALSLGPSTPNDLLILWANTILLRSSTNDALDLARKFKVPRFLIYCSISDVLQGNDRIPEAIICFQQMQGELTSDANISDERVRWEQDFQRRCTQRLEQLSDAETSSGNYKEAVDHLTTTLSLGPTERVDTLIKRSRARVMMGSWQDALIDAEKVIQLDPSSYRGYEQIYAALHGAGRYSEAVEAFDTMLLKLGHELRGQYIDARPRIRGVIHETVAKMPRVLIDTTTGRLYDRAQLGREFEAHPIFAELVSSMTRKLDDARVLEEVKKFYKYVMLSHKWGQDEPLFQDVEHISVDELKPSAGNDKLKMFCSAVRSHGFRWGWSDTCCVDKVNKVVLEESLVAMFSWYRGSALVLVHLIGVMSHSKEPGGVKKSIWNTRAWTYQEYTAADRVWFYTQDWKPYLDLTLQNHKDSPIIISEMDQAYQASAGQVTVLQPGLDRVRAKLYLASIRQTTLVEDIAYSLLGIFNVTIPVIYGEGNRAVARLLEHVLTSSGDVTILAWTGTSNEYHSCLPTNLTAYNQLVPPHFPASMQIAEMDQIVTVLHSSFPDLSLVMTLYDELNALPPPSFVSTRLRLPGIIFLAEVVRVSGPDPETRVCAYRASMAMLGDVEITTRNDLTAMNALFLVHPWIRSLLESPRSPSKDYKTTRALRSLARLMQPFGALLFEQVSRVEYKRVAADALIMVQIRKDVSLDGLIDNVCTIDVQ